MGISRMAAVELDPHFIKALRLLRSKSKDSGAQLRAMLDDAIRQKKGLGPAPRSPSVSKQHSRSVSSDGTIDKDRSEKDKKKDLDRLKKDLSELADKPSDPKRARLDSPALSSSSHTPSPTPPPSRGEADASDGGGSEVEFGDLEMNLEFDCSCCVCKTFTQESGNKLMECSSCQNLYHQECHNPPVSNHEASDPRLIWNCVKCIKKSIPGGKPASSSSSSLLKEERKSEKEKSSKSSLSSGSSSKRSSSLKGDSGRGSSVTGSSVSGGSGSSKSKSGSSGATSSSSGSSTELSSSARKRIKLIKKQAAAATSISKKKSK